MYDLEGLFIKHIEVPNPKWRTVSSFGANTPKAVEVLIQLGFTVRQVGNYDVEVLGDKLTSEKARMVFLVINLTKLTKLTKQP